LSDIREYLIHKREVPQKGTSFLVEKRVIKILLKKMKIVLDELKIK